MSKRLILMRGITGSGKSTLAKQLVDQGQIFSTDDYFMVDGKYNFDASLLGIYHNKNVNRAKDAMISGVSPVVIDNTNLTLRDMRPYLELAKEFDYDIEVAQIDLDDVDELVKRQSGRKSIGKNLPVEVIKYMKDKFQKNWKELLKDYL
jgi:predicted kinase